MARALQVVCSIVLALALPIAAQIPPRPKLATCTNKALNWTYNALHQSPCEVAGQVGAICTPGFTVVELREGYLYLGPTAEAANACRCSAVYYSLISACAACQSGEYMKWSKYRGNCTGRFEANLPYGLPNGTLVPGYAFLDVTADDTFNLTRARERTLAPPPAPKISNAGPIAGGIIGGSVLLALAAVLVLWLLRWRRRRAIAATVSTAGVAAQAPGRYTQNSKPRLKPSALPKLPIAASEAQLSAMPMLPSPESSGCHSGLYLTPYNPPGASSAYLPSPAASTPYLLTPQVPYNRPDASGRTFPSNPSATSLASHTSTSFHGDHHNPVYAPNWASQNYNAGRAGYGYSGLLPEV